LYTTSKEIEVLVDFYDTDSIFIVIDYLDPLIDSYIIKDRYLCKNPEDMEYIEFHFENENYTGKLISYARNLRLNYSSDVCEVSYFSIYLE